MGAREENLYLDSERLAARAASPATRKQYASIYRSFGDWLRLASSGSPTGPPQDENQGAKGPLRRTGPTGSVVTMVRTRAQQLEQVAAVRHALRAGLFCLSARAVS